MNFLSLFLVHHNIIHTAIPIDKQAWSEGKELWGKNLCKIVSIFSYSNHNKIFGLTLSQKNCTTILNNIDKTQDQNIHKADSL